MTITWSSTPVEGEPILSTKYTATNRLVAHDYGPLDKEDVSMGLYDYIWKCWVDESDNVWLQNLTTGAGATLEFNQSGIVNLDVTFDQLGHPVIAFDNGSTISLYWYDPTIASQTITNFGSGKRVCISLDERRVPLLERGNIIVAYQIGNDAFIRIQDDRYTVQYATPLVGVTDLNVCGISFTDQLRIQIAYLPKPA